MNRRVPLAVLLIVLALVLTSCVPASTVPISTISFPGRTDSTHQSLVVFLPGRGGSASDFGVEGMVQALKEKHPDIDSIAVEAHLGYYRDRTIALRLKEDVIAPAQKRGYRNIWLVGISMGGLGALLYDTSYPGDLTGVCVFAPYLGDGLALEDIDRAGGLGKWQPAGDQLDLDRQIWQALTPYAATRMHSRRVYLGYGTKDRFAGTNRFFARVLPAEQVVTADGAHDWPTWRTLWERTLERAPLAPAAPGAVSAAGDSSILGDDK